ncbi:probable phosphoglycerate mutase [Ureibacillus xyleni]|uniref:Probable phosphoglycerate mutase n=1 Tax=Ureibacillus xyleni TaxID=614648 RepID=A0A285RJK1_9BACL|nr:histidine phosphatase family protein [Ureibacillus xyleni]SOB93849.1 probable phosphoglycerate mutase [Ureibacillus xyleni]
MSRVELYFIRHGETEWNKEGRLQGWLNSELTENGRDQVKALQQELQHIKFNAVYSSPLQRAVETANILVGETARIKLDDRLREIHLGSWQGRKIADIWEEDYDRYFAYCNKPQCYKPDSGESFLQVSARMTDLLMDCSNKYKEGKILFITHAVAIRALLLNVLGLECDRIWNIEEIDGASVTKLVVENNQITVQYIGKIINNHNVIEI